MEWIRIRRGNKDPNRDVQHSLIHAIHFGFKSTRTNGMSVHSQGDVKVIMSEIKGTRMRVRLPYKSSENITKVIETLPLRHHIFGFAGPFSSLPLCFVFGYPLERWTLSWIDFKWFPAICNGTSLVSNNIFIRIPLRGMELESNDKEWKGLKELEGYSPSRISELYWAGEIIDSMPESKNDWFVPGLHFRDTEKLDIQPTLEEGKTTIIDHPELENKDCEWTHYFYSPLLEADLRKISSVTDRSQNPLAWEVGKALLENEEYSPRLGFWHTINIGWNIRNYESSNLESEVVHDGIPLPLDAALWNVNRLHDALLYRRFLREKGITRRAEEDTPCADEFFKLEGVSSHEFPNWYLVHIGATLIEDMKIEIRDYQEALWDGQMEYAELFLKNCTVRDFKSFLPVRSEMSKMSLQEFKLLEKYIRIEYSELLPVRELRASLYCYQNDSFIFDVGKALNTGIVIPGVDGIPNHNTIKLSTDEISKYLIRSRGVEAFLPSAPAEGESRCDFLAFRICKLSRMAVISGPLTDHSNLSDEWDWINYEIITMMILEIVDYIENESKREWIYMGVRISKFALWLSNISKYLRTRTLFGRADKIADAVSKGMINRNNIKEWIDLFKI